VSLDLQVFYEMKRILLIDGHPDPAEARFVHALAAAYAAGATGAGHDVQLIRLADLDIPMLRSNADFFGGVMTPPISQAQQSLSRCDHLVIVYPLWLGSMPALLKAFLEQLFRRNAAYTDNDRRCPAHRALRGKSARIIVTMGMPALLYRWYFGALSVRTLKRHILGFLGVSPIRSSVIGGVESLSDAERAAILLEMQSLGRRGV
jgi:putative NADPH-quinone reductase